MKIKRARASSRREEILAATVDLVADVGHQRVRVADVAGKLGVSPSLIIYHFATKDELVADAFKLASQNDLISVRRIAKSSREPLQRVVDIMRWYAPTEGSKSWNLWIDGWSASLWNPLLAEVLTSVDREWKKTVAQAIIAVRPELNDVEAHDLAIRLMAFVDGLAVARVARTADLPLSKLGDWVEEFVRAELAEES